MKTIALSFTFVFFLTVAVFAGNENVVKSTISNVTVFPSSAQITRTANFTAGSGVSEIIFENVSSYVNTLSIQAKGKGNFTILDVQFRFKQPEIILSNQSYEIPTKILREISLLEDSIVFTNFDLNVLTDQISSLNYEKDILMNNPLVKGFGGDTITELKATMDYFRLKITDINSQLQKLSRQEYQTRRMLERMEVRLNELRAYNIQENPVVVPKSPIPQIVVTITSDLATSGSLEINYMVNSAGWTPTYDLRTTGIDQPVQLVYKANVWQSTGEDWNNAKLKLSTITPSANNVKPILPIYYLGYNNYYRTETISMDNKKERSAAPSSVAYGGIANESEDMIDADYSYNYTSVVQTMTNVEFEIKLNYTVPSDGQAHMIPIQSENIPTEYVYYIVPKLESQAFLIAKLTDWEKLDLLPGMANIYFDGTFIGETSINPSTLMDTLELALGRDRSLQIERKLAKSETTSKLIGSICTKTFNYEITIKNTKAVKTSIVVQDHIPVSTDEEIKVVMLNDGKSKYSKETGLLQWNEKIEASSTKKYSYSYSVEYDQNKPIILN
jgi:uncharacterized protein (TIGR02231 family)